MLILRQEQETDFSIEDHPQSEESTELKEEESDTESSPKDKTDSEDTETETQSEDSSADGDEYDDDFDEEQDYLEIKDEGYNEEDEYVEFDSTDNKESSGTRAQENRGAGTFISGGKAAERFASQGQQPAPEERVFAKLFG
jgi:hypothetical protein